MKKVLIWCIRYYQWVLSPWKPLRCRFYPTCSTYALQAIAKHGALRGGFLAFRRILRCHPFCPGGYDPVPETAPHLRHRTKHPLRP